MTFVPRPCSIQLVRWLLLVLLALALVGCAATPPMATLDRSSSTDEAAASPISASRPTTPIADRDDDRPRAADGDALETEADGTGYGMLYFPSAGQSVQLVTDIALNRLYEDALPGYGLYTFVLLGAGFERASGDDLARHSELFRMIETYVVTAGDAEGSSAEAHVFLVPIRAGRSPTAPLMDLAAADLSDLMRRQLGELLRQRGQGRLAARIERGAGPFLVSGLEPRLLPLDGESPRLIADLSRLGPEHLYSLVDAYDRDIPAEARDRPESLSALRQRLLDLPLKARSGSGSGREADDTRWIVLI